MVHRVDSPEVLTDSLSIPGDDAVTSRVADNSGLQ